MSDLLVCVCGGLGDCVSVKRAIGTPVGLSLFAWLWDSHLPVGLCALCLCISKCACV